MINRFKLQLEDPMGEATAKMNIADLHKILNLPDSTSPDEPSNSTKSEAAPALRRIQRVRRESMEQLDLIKVADIIKTAQSFI